MILTKEQAIEAFSNAYGRVPRIVRYTAFDTAHANGTDFTFGEDSLTPKKAYLGAFSCTIAIDNFALLYVYFKNNPSLNIRGTYNSGYAGLKVIPFTFPLLIFNYLDGTAPASGSSDTVINFVGYEATF